MLTTIQELEQEIEQFHKNIKDSNELIKILMSVVSLTKTQTESFEIHVKNLQDDLEKLPPDISELIKSKVDNIIQEMNKENQKVIEKFQTVPEQIKEDSVQQERLFLKELEKKMDAHLIQISTTEKNVIELSQKLEIKYESFVAKLEATNIDQLYKYCQDMNKSINTKLGIVLSGVVVAIIVSVISLFI